MPKLIFVGLAILCSLHIHAQYKKENSMSQYFENRSLWNPSLTGADGNRLHLLHNRSWFGFDGAPVLTAFTGHYLFGKNSAGGLQITSDASGIVYRTTGALNYAYRISFDKTTQLRLGFNLLFNSERIDNRKLDAAAINDPLILSNINQEPGFDANFGAYYETKRLSVGASFYRLKEMFSANKRNNADINLMRGAITYDLIDEDTEEKLKLTSLGMVSFYRNTKAVYDIGLRMNYAPVTALLVYQTTGNIKMGLGLNIQKAATVNFYYNIGTGKYEVPVQQLEIGVNYRFTDNKK